MSGGISLEKALRLLNINRNELFYLVEEHLKLEDKCDDLFIYTDLIYQLIDNHILIPVKFHNKKLIKFTYSLFVFYYSGPNSIQTRNFELYHSGKNTKFPEMQIQHFLEKGKFIIKFPDRNLELQLQFNVN